MVIMHVLLIGTDTRNTLVGFLTVLNKLNSTFVGTMANGNLLLPYHGWTISFI